MKLIESVIFKNYKGFKELYLDNMQAITLIAGKNNAGKSSLLEGIFLFMDHSSPESFLKINAFRGAPVTSVSVRMWEPLFYNFCTDQPMTIEVKGKKIAGELSYRKDDTFVPINTEQIPPEQMNAFINSAKSSYTLEYQYKSNDYNEKGHFSIGSGGILRNVMTSLPGNRVQPMAFTQYLNSRLIWNDSAIVDWYGQLELQGMKKEVVDALRAIDDRISDISTISSDGMVQLYVNISGSLIPLKLAGDGMYRLLYLVMALLAHPGSLLLVDEIENGFHHSMYTKLWELLAKISKKSDCQIIATTHSYECIAASVEGMKNAGRTKDFCLSRLECAEGIGKSYNYTSDLLEHAINSDLEVR
ncbi:MAG: AAA family ATPase [Lachnospiraceae bacterium]|nr:AAA family ATPase [Lachnospiraceae bacterium]